MAADEDPLDFRLTHDSIGLARMGQPPGGRARGESAPDPDMDVWRPCDTVETLIAWAAAIERRDGPTSLLLSRQSVAFLRGSADEAAIRRGGLCFLRSRRRPGRGRGPS